MFTATSWTTALVVFLLRAQAPDDRLIGTWQSDAGRTIAHLREHKSVDDKQEAGLRKIFGKLRLTYTASVVKSEMNGTAETEKYEVLGKDKRSVVIRVPRKTELPEALEGSEFTLIHFDGPDSYWIYIPLVNMREYFKRVR
jgi:hypothetical protein